GAGAANAIRTWSSMLTSLSPGPTSSPAPTWRSVTTPAPATTAWNGAECSTVSSTLTGWSRATVATGTTSGSGGASARSGLATDWDTTHARPTTAGASAPTATTAANPRGHRGRRHHHLGRLLGSGPPSNVSAPPGPCLPAPDHRPPAPGPRSAASVASPSAERLLQDCVLLLAGPAARASS